MEAMYSWGLYRNSLKDAFLFSLVPRSKVWVWGTLHGLLSSVEDHQGRAFRFRVLCMDYLAHC